MWAREDTAWHRGQPVRRQHSFLPHGRGLSAEDPSPSQLLANQHVTNPLILRK